jgi:hypothetical protein
MEDLRAAEEERVPADWDRQAEYFAVLTQVITTLATSVIQARQAPLRPMHVIVEDIRNVQSHINDALAELCETERGNGNGNEEQALVHVASIDARLQWERRFLSHLQNEYNWTYDWTVARMQAQQFGNGERVPFPNAEHVPRPNATRVPESNNRGGN